MFVVFIFLVFLDCLFFVKYDCFLYVLFGLSGFVMGSSVFKIMYVFMFVLFKGLFIWCFVVFVCDVEFLIVKVVFVAVLISGVSLVFVFFNF